MERKDALKKEIKILRERYDIKVGRFKYFMNCLQYAKEAIKQKGVPYMDEYIGQEDALKTAISEYKNYKFCVKEESKELKELKIMIRELDREIRSNSI